jgi:pterin-4a-carbinolamine dehydratase/uncharacterized protein (DUF2267 family)
MRKQREGDNQRRRALARQARDRGRSPSEEGVSLGASKQFEHTRGADRAGPPPAGTGKPHSGKPIPPTPAPPGEQWPVDPPDVYDQHPGGVRYRDFVQDVGHRIGLGFDDARRATEATVTVLAQSLPDLERQRLLDQLPGLLRDEEPAGVPRRERGLPDLLDEIARLAGGPTDQARYRAQAVLSALGEWNRDLVESLELPAGGEDLGAPLPVGGGRVDPRGHAAPLSEDELRAALAALPNWSGNRRALSRTIQLPRANLDRVVARLDRLHEEAGRGPRIARPSDDTAVVVVWTTNVGAVTALDIDLAHRVDGAIDEVGAGIA